MSATLAVGLTGGIGSGKSVVCGLFADRGAVVIEADAIAREALGPGGFARQGVLSRFGQGIVAPDGEIDRAALAEIVFADSEALTDLNLLTHPGVRAQMRAKLAVECDRRTPVVVLDIPLLVEGARALWPLDAVVVVDAPVELAVARLVEKRGMSESQARARIAAQAGRPERLAAADLVIDNSSDLGHLEAEVESAWGWLARLSASTDRVAKETPS